jgi:hypothetical protein
MKGLRQTITGAALAAIVGASVSCGDVVRDGRSSVYLVMDSLTGSAGGKSTSTPAYTLHSDVVTLIRTPLPCSDASPCATLYSDSGQAAFHLAPKNVTATGATAPTQNSDVTLTRYRVMFRRTDGHNTPGVDVPYGFDAAITAVISVGGGGSVNFELVRHTSKQESPLAQLAYNPTIISTVADVTFYGHDQVGNDISVTGSMQVDFGDFGDQ